MIQVTSCEQALKKKRKGNRFKTTKAKQCFFLKLTHLNLSLTEISSTWLAIRECRVGFPCFLQLNSALSRFLCKMTVLQSLTSKIDHIWIDYDRILPFTDHKSTLLRFWYIYKA